MNAAFHRHLVKAIARVERDFSQTFSKVAHNAQMALGVAEVAESFLQKLAEEGLATGFRIDDTLTVEVVSYAKAPRGLCVASLNERCTFGLHKALDQFLKEQDALNQASDNPWFRLHERQLAQSIANGFRFFGLIVDYRVGGVQVGATPQNPEHFLSPRQRQRLMSETVDWAFV